MYQKTAAVILSSFLSFPLPPACFPASFLLAGSSPVLLAGSSPVPFPSAAGGRAALTASPFRHWCAVVWYACRTHATFLHLSARVSYLSQAVLDCRLNDSVVCSLC